MQGIIYRTFVRRHFFIHSLGVRQNPFGLRDINFIGQLFGISLV